MAGKIQFRDLRQNDKIGYDPGTGLVQLWRQTSHGEEVVAENQCFVRDRNHLKHMVEEAGRIAGLNCIQEINPCKFKLVS